MKGFPEAVQAMVSKSSKSGVQVQVHTLDLTNADNVQAWIAHYAPQMDVCIHSAALSVPPLCQADPQTAQALNVPSVFLEGLAQHDVSIIALSTDQVYDGESNPKPYYSETSPVAPLNTYGTTKVQLEECLGKLSQKYSNSKKQLTTVALRSSIMLGPKAPILGDQAHATFLHFCAGRQDQETTFYTDECRSVIAVDNVVDVLRWFASACLLQNGDDKNSPPNANVVVGGVYNMGGPERVSRYDMAQAVFRHFGYDEEKLVAAEKASLPSQEVKSPLDIAMDSSKLYLSVGNAVQFKGMKDIVSWTFADQGKQSR